MTVHSLLDVEPTDVLGITRALVDIPSESGNEDLIVEQITAWISRHRPEAAITHISKSIVVRIGDVNVEPIIFAGHLDTVPAAEHNGTSNQTSSIDGDNLYGVGTSDMKGGVAVMLALLATTQVSSTFIFYEAEEIDDRYNGLGLIAQSHPEFLQGTCAIVTEPTDAQLELGCQGVLRIQATCTGIKAHSARPWAGENAIHKAVKVLDKLEEASNSQPEVEIDGLTYTPALQVTMISGGVSSNVIPDECLITINYRFAPNVSIEQAEAYIRELTADADSVEITSKIPGGMPFPEHPLAVFGKKKGKELVPKIAWTDVSRFSGLGIPAVNFGPGDPKVAHKSDEHVKINQLQEAYDFIAEFLDEL